MTDPEEDRRRTAMAALALLASVVVAYAGSWAGPFQFDDWWAVVDNPAVRDIGAWWQALPGIRPLLKLSYALNWTLGDNAFGFHAVNLAIHGANVLLLWRLLRHWLAMLAPSRGRPELAAFAGALLFALHPAATEAVTYVSGRSVSLMATFYLASLLAQARAWRQPAAADSGWAWLSVGLFALALAVRETAATLPLALLLLAGLAGRPWPDTARSLRGHGVVLVVAVIGAALTPGYHSFFGWSLQTRGLGEQVLGQLEAHRYLLFHTLLGLQTNIDPDLRVPATLTPGAALFAVAGLAALALAWAGRRRAPWLAFAVGWYLLQLAPSNSLLPRFDLGNDRHLYLALAGPALGVAAGLAALRPRVAGLALGLLAAVLGSATVQRNREYASELALWTATVAASPGKARPWVNLGHARQLAGDRDGARHAYRCALVHDPGHRQAAINLAVLGGARPGAGEDGRCRTP